MSAFESQAAHAPLPGAGTQITVPSGSASAATDLNAFMGKWVMVIASVKTHIRAGSTNAVAAATTDVWLPADVPQQFKVTEATRWLSTWGNGGAGLLSVAQVDV